MTDTEENVRIRAIEAKNVADLIRIGNETNLSPWSAQNYLDELKNKASIMLRLECDSNSTIGFIVGRMVPGGETETRIDAEIYNIAVTEAEQNKGHGQRLFEKFSRICGERGVVNIWLDVRESNQKAIAFYRKNGFEPVQTRRSLYNNPREHAILMRKVCPTLKKSKLDSSNDSDLE